MFSKNSATSYNPKKWQMSLLAKRFNDYGAAICILDNIISLMTSSSGDINDFFQNTIPYYVNAIYYIVPSFVPLLMYAKNVCCAPAEIKEMDDDESETANLTTIIIDELKTDKDTELYLNQHPVAHRQLQDKLKDVLTKLKETLQIDNNEKIDILINVIYFIFRTMHGVIIPIDANDLSSGDITAKVTEGLAIASGIVNILYMTAVFFHNSRQAKKNEKAFASAIKKDDSILEPIHSFFAKKQETKVFENKKSSDDTPTTSLLNPIN